MHCSADGGACRARFVLCGGGCYRWRARREGIFVLSWLEFGYGVWWIDLRRACRPWCMVPLAPRCKQSIADGKAGSPVLGRDSRKLPDSRQRRKKIGGPMSCGDGGRLGCLAGVRSTFSGARPSVGLQLLDLACGIANEAGSNFEWRQPVKLFPACYRSACDAKRTGDGGSRN